MNYKWCHQTCFIDTCRNNPCSLDASIILEIRADQTCINLIWFSTFKAMDSCGPEVAALKRSIRKLENKLLIGAWQVEHLQMHKYFRPLQPTQSNKDLAPDTDADVKNNSSGALYSSNVTMMNPLPPAGNLIVYDKGKKSSHPLSVSVCKVKVWDLQSKEPTVHERILRMI